MHPQRILFVCLGNICRSPTAEYIARARFAKAGLAIHVESRGTGDWHVGDQADARAIAAGALAGYDLLPHRASQLSVKDFSSHDFLFAMDASNLENMRKLCPPDYRDRMGLFMQESAAAPPLEVPDPYYGANNHFEQVIAMLERGVDGLIAQWKA